MNRREQIAYHVLPALAAAMRPEPAVKAAFEVADCFLKYTGSSDAGSSLPADDDQASGETLPPSAPEATPSEREAGRQRVESGGGKGIRQYMDEDRADEEMAERVKDTLFDPAFIQAMELGEEGDYKIATRIRDAIKHTTNVKDAERLAALMRETLKRRREIESKELFTALSTEARNKIDSLS